MKFDPFRMQEVPCGKDMEGHSPLEVVTSAPVALYVSSQGYEALVGYGATFDVSVDGPFSFRVEAAKGERVRCFVNSPPVAAFEPSGVIFTNHERGLEESGMLYEVKKALRQQRLEHAQFMQNVRAETAKAIAAQALVAKGQESAEASAADASAEGEGVPGES